MSGLDVEYPLVPSCASHEISSTNVALLLCSSSRSSVESPAASAPSKIVLAYASMVARTSFIWIAQDRGFFAKYGIDPELILMSRGPVLIAGSLVATTSSGGRASRQHWRNRRAERRRRWHRAEAHCDFLIAGG